MDVELFCFGLGTGFGAVEDDGRLFQVGVVDDSWSEPLSQASSSPQSDIA